MATGGTPHLGKGPMTGTVYDVGANNGDDTAFYLAKGFRTVAVEADPALGDALRARFADALAEGRLIVENVGIAEAHGTLPFFVNAFSDWSSFVRGSKATGENTYREIEVTTEPLSAIIARNGAPHYVKLDIEGFELAAIRSLVGMGAPPPYLSFEINPEWQECVDTLRALGYRRFQVVRQGGEFLPRCPVPAREGQDVQPAFNNRMSGPFGRDLPDAWVEAAEVEDAVAAMFATRRRNVEQGLKPGWHDIHCALA